MSSQNEFLKSLIERLEEAEIDYMVSGSLGSSFYGEPRATNDIDMVIAPNQRQLEVFIKSLGENYYVSPEAAWNALSNKSMFNIIDTKGGWKADLIIRKQRPFSRKEFTRRHFAEIMEIKLFVVSAEDAILSKLEWCKETDSERQFRDAVGVATVQWPKLDKDYLHQWSQELGVADLLAMLINEVENLPELPEPA